MSSRNANSLESALSFARALDAEDFERAGRLMFPECVYDFRGQITSGREAILKSYRDNAAWARANLDEIRYESRVTPLADGRFAVDYADLVRHRGETLDYRCRQILTLDEAGLVVRIEHVDLPGEEEKKADFMRRVGVSR